MLTLVFLEDTPPCKMVYYAFRICGFMHHDGRPWSVIYTVFQWISIDTFGVLTCRFTVLEALLGGGTPQDFVEATALFSTFVMTIPKMINYLQKEKEIRSILNRLDDLRTEILKDEDNFQTINEARKLGRKTSIIVSAIVLGTPCLAILQSTIYDFQTDFKYKRIFPLMWIPWSIEEVWPYMGGKLLAISLGVSVVLANLAFAIFQFTFTTQMAAFLEILQKYFETKGPADRMIYDQHKIMIQLIHDYNEIFSAQMMLDTVVSPILPCGYGLGLIRGLRQKNYNQADTVAKIITCTLPPFIVCVSAQKIITEVERLHEASYMSKWYEEKPKVRKDLLILMKRTLKPTSLNYRLLFKFDHECLAGVLQGLYSFFMLVINFDT